MYYMPQTGEILPNHSAVRDALPNVMFFDEMNDDRLATHGVFTLYVDEKPADCAKVFTAGTPELRDGFWFQPWVARDATAEEIDAAQRAAINVLIKGAVDQLNAFAATRIYGDELTSPIVAACSFAASPHPRYGPEGRYCLEARDATWDVLNKLQADVFAGRRALPASVVEIEELPVLKWPDATD